MGLSGLGCALGGLVREKVFEDYIGVEVEELWGEVCFWSAL